VVWSGGFLLGQNDRWRTAWRWTPRRALMACERTIDGVHRERPRRAASAWRACGQGWLCPHALGSNVPAGSRGGRPMAWCDLCR
jgi:hypothetical protein